MSKQTHENGDKQSPRDTQQVESLNTENRNQQAEMEQADASGESRAEPAETASQTDRENGEISVAQLQEEIQRQQDEIMRLTAEMDNIRKRNARELENLRKYALDKFTKELLPVVDSMEKAMQIDRENATVDQVLEGTALTQKILHKVLRQHGLEVIDPQGEKFDPEQHEAVSAVPAEDNEPNTVLDVFQKGYKLNGRVVRPAMVVVAK